MDGVKCFFLIVNIVLVLFILINIPFVKYLVYERKKNIGMTNRYRHYYSIMNYWFRAKQSGKQLAEVLLKRGYKSVAIYGMRELGETLYHELLKSDITVMYCIDKNANNIYSEHEIVTIDDINDEPDCVIVTVIHYYEEILEELSKRIDSDIVPLDEIVFDM